MSEREELEAVIARAVQSTHGTPADIATALLSSGYTKGNGEPNSALTEARAQGAAEERDRLMALALGSEADNYASYDGYVAEWLRSQKEQPHD